MTYQDWLKENYAGGYNQAHSCNSLDWQLVEMSDGWIAVWQYSPYLGVYSPAIQARDLGKAMDYIAFRESPNVPLRELVRRAD